MIVTYTGDISHRNSTEGVTMSKVTENHNKLAAAHAFLSTLRVGQAVTLTQDGKESAVTVQRPLRRHDGFGHPHGAVVTVGYGPGRYNREVSAETLAAGNVELVPAN